jgi:uncharacterized membrane protein YqhA
MNADDTSNDKIMWCVVLHLTFVVSAVLLGVLDRRHLRHIATLELRNAAKHRAADHLWLASHNPNKRID